MKNDKPITIGALIDAIHQVETSGALDAPDGDGGRSIGPLQISKACYKDAKYEYFRCSRNTSWFSYEEVRNISAARMVFYWYIFRWAKQQLYNLTLEDCEKISRIWNGGPTGHRKKSTGPYWEKVKTALFNQKKCK